jgi:DNA-directed RNA polymerase II subunit RPB2
MESISWKIIDTYFKDNPSSLVAHHLESYNNFFDGGINRIFKENNPARFIERQGEDNKVGGRNECLLYLGGKDGSRIYFGKPIIYDANYAHYMYPNDARLRNMTYGTTIHYDVEIDVIYYDEEAKERKTKSVLLEKMYLGRFPIMLKSKLCILNKLSSEVCFNMGECRNDYGGYFIIDGKEKLIIPQETFADNMLYVRANKPDDTYSYSAEIRSVSEDASKPMRTTSVKMVAPSSVLSNNQLVVDVPNVRKPVPLFILMRALGVISDKRIIETCLLDIERNSSYVDLFIPSIHDASKIFDQRTALEFIATFTKRQSVPSVLEILMNYFLPHVGTNNFLDKAYFLGTMVHRLLRVSTKEDKPTDRDNFKFKRIEQTGKLIYDLFREYYLIQKQEIMLAIDTEYYFHKGEYKGNFSNLIEANYRDFFKLRSVEAGFRKAFKGNWGSQARRTQRLGVVQDVNRLSWNSFISQMRKLNLPLDASAKVVGPRHLNGSQWGYIDPVDTPDGGNIGLHKHLAISTQITSGFSSYPLIQWLRANTPMKILQECTPVYLSQNTKMIVNGNWIGVIADPMEVVELLKLLRRNGVLPTYMSISFDYAKNEIYMYTDAGRLTRPIYYIDNKKPSYDRAEFIDQLNSGKVTWEQLVTGFKEKADDDFDIRNNKLYGTLNELYKSDQVDLNKYKAMVDFLDTSEEEGALIATYLDDLKKSKFYTHLEIHPSLILGVMGNMVIYPENNPYARDAFSCGQSKQAVSMYHSNYQMRIDKMGVILNCGQIPLLKSRYLDIINKEQMPYGVNAIVAIMSYTGYNVEDAILINQGAVDRGIFRTTYYSMYEAHEESTKVAGTLTNAYFTDVSKKEVSGLKAGYDYSYLDKWGMIKENTPLDDKMVLIGKITSSGDLNVDNSVTPKKGQLGFVDKSFITEGEEGFRIGKVRIREERIPSIGDKMASRAGQKGTIGLIIPEDDMPFTADGIRPDLIINPHAIPSRMTIGQLIESMFGKACCAYGGFGDCTAFTTKGSNVNTYGYMLAKAGFHSSGNQLLYNGMTGEQLRSDIYIGPTYYMRLKHMVKDKINYRARGPRTALTRQTVQGRANDGGLRVGEMERDAVISHGAAAFLSESFLVRGDEYYMAVCNKTGMIAIYNPAQNIFLSPGADGPVKFHTTMEGKMTLEMVSQYGRSFSILRIPYSLKLLIQELQVMNIQMRIITNENVDTLMSMSYSDNIIKVTNNEVKFQRGKEGDDPINQYVREYKRTIDKLFSKESGKRDLNYIPSYESESESESKSSEYRPGSESDGFILDDRDDSIPRKVDTPSEEYRPDTGSDAPISDDSIPRKVDTPSSESGRYTPPMPPPPPSEMMRSSSDSFVPPPPPSEMMRRSSSSSSDSFIPPPPASSESDTSEFGSEELNAIYRKLDQGAKQKLDALSRNERISVLRKVADKRKESEPQADSTAILDVENLDEDTDAEKKEAEESSSKSETKSVQFDDKNSSSSSETKQVKL